jgi:hypothetical protein
VNFATSAARQEPIMSVIHGIRIKNPAHLGGFVKNEIIEALGLSVTDVAEVLG